MKITSSITITMVLVMHLSLVTTIAPNPGATVPEPVTITAICSSPTDTDLFSSLAESETIHARGVVIRNSMIVSTNHKISLNCHIVVDGKPATIRNASATHDLLLLQVDSIAAEQVSYNVTPQVGDKLYRNSCMQGLCELLLIGKIEAITADYIYTSYKTRQGDSGDGIYSETNELIGIIKGSVVDKATKKNLGTAIIKAANIKKLAG